MRHALLCLVLLASPAFAEDPKGPNPEGDYGGVQPGQGKKPEPKKAKKERFACGAQRRRSSR